MKASGSEASLGVTRQVRWHKMGVWQHKHAGISWREQVAVQLRIGGMRGIVSMARGVLARSELEFETLAQDVPQLRGAVDLLNAARMRSAWRREARRAPTDDLGFHERRGFSQNGEDGVLEWIFSIIGTTNRWLIEIGSSDGEENCTRSLVEHGWTGLWVEADRERARRSAQVAAGRVAVVNVPAEPSTAEEILRGVGVPDKPDLLVVDIDGNDWWVLRAVLSSISPRVLVAEYNSTYLPGQWWVEPYRKGRRWDGSFRHGASLQAIAALAASFGLMLVGCDSTGVNCFFVANTAAPELQSLSLGSIGNLYRAPWFTSGLWGHPRRRDAFVPAPPAVRLSDDELHSVSLEIQTWPIPSITRVSSGEPVVLQATIANGACKPLTSGGNEALHLATRWRLTEDAPQPWLDEPRLKVPPIEPGHTVRTRFWRKAPLSPGHYWLEAALVQENVSWLHDQQTGIALEVMRFAL